MHHFKCEQQWQQNLMDQSLLIREHAHADWRTLLTVNFEDTLKDDLYCGLLGFSADGKSLFLIVRWV